jgi:large subunit ribosomal protein L32
MAPLARHACPHCHAPKLPHRVCPSCGYYNGREVVAPPAPDFDE